MTIHKGQGQTLDLVQTDLSSERIFEYGQAYVALSRATTLDGLYLSRFNRDSICCHPKVIDFYKKALFSCVALPRK